MSSSPKTNFSISAIAAKAKHVALTYPQVYAPSLAGAAVRAVTGGSGKGSGAGQGKKSAPKLPVSQAMKIGDAGERYAPTLPNNGRTSGILVAQAAAAPAAPDVPVDQTLTDQTTADLETHS